MTPVDLVLSALEARGCNPRRSGDGWVARCPSHEDRNPSLSVSEGRDGRALVYCFAGCSIKEIVAALGLELKHLMPPGEGRPKTKQRPGLLVWSPQDIAIPPLENFLRINRRNFDCLVAKFQQAADPSRLAQFARELGVSVESLRRLGIGYALGRRSWAFPMRSPTGDIVGIRLRGIDGSKRSIRGSRQGLFIPEGLRPGGLLLVCEGPTDTAAALTLGFEAIGRPSCSGGGDMVIELVWKQKPATVVVIADNDKPGREGAGRVAERLAYWSSNVRQVIPNEAKDLREWVQRGVTRETVLKACEQAEEIQPYDPTLLIKENHLLWTVN